MSARSKKKPAKLTAGQSVSDYFVKGTMLVYVFFMLVLYPLLYHNKYFDMGAAKYAIFKWTSVIVLSFMTIIWGIWLYNYKDKVDPVKEVKSFSITDILVLAFMGVSLLSYIFAANRGMALWGYEGWFMGLMSQLFFVLTYVYVSRFWEYNNATLVCMVGAAAICYQIGILQRFGYNPLGMYDGVGEEDIEKFLSTLGQTSWYSSYAVMIVPFGMYFYWKTENMNLRIVTGFFTALGFGMLCTTNSDSAYVAMTLILMVFFRYSLEDNEKMKRFLEIVIIGLFSLRVVGWMHAIFPEKQRTYITGEERISKFVTSSGWMLALLLLMMLVYAVFWIVSSRPKNGSSRRVFDISKYKKIIWSVTVAAAVLVIWGMMMIIILVTTEKMPAAFGKLYEIEFFRFDNIWGNHRGFNWRAAMIAFSHASFKDLLIGVGPDCFAEAMNKYCYAEVAEYWHGLQLACAHNEWLNMLVTEGILGLAAYLGIFISIIVRASKHVKEEPAMIPLIAGVLAYVGHNIFCYQQCICTPVVFIFAGMAERLIRSRKKV